MDIFWFWFLENFYPVILSAFALLLSVFAIQIRREFAETRRYVKRLNLFRIRDELRLQVALGVIDEDSKLYQHYDKALNTLLKHTERISVYELILNARELSESETQAREAILDLVKKSPQKIQSLIHEFYLEVAKIFISQSKILVLLIPAFTMIRFCGGIVRLTRFVPKARLFEEAKAATEARYLASVAARC